MKLALFNDYLPGIVHDDAIVDISTHVCMGTSGQETLQNIMADWDQLHSRLNEIATTTEGVPLSSVRLRAPVPWPSKIMCAASNYREGTDMPARPMRAFLSPPTAILDPEGVVVFPNHEIRVWQHEAELVCVVGKLAKDVSEDAALGYIFGYTTGVDVSPRTEHWGFLAKSFDGHKPIGPWIVTADEIGDPNELQVQLSVDGVLRQDYNTKDMAHSIAEFISWLSSFMTLLPGDLLFLGTNHQQLGPLQDGESVEMGAEKIGSFRFSIKDPLKRSWPKEIDARIAEHARERLRENASILRSQ